MISVLFHHDIYDYYWDVYVRVYSFWITDLSFLKLDNLAPTIVQFPEYFCPWTFC